MMNNISTFINTNKIVLNNILLFIYLLLYNYFLFFNEENSSTTFIVISIYSFIFLKLCFIANKYVYRISILLFFIVGIIQYVIIQMFGLPKEEQYTAIYFTNVAETASYLRILPLKLAGIAIILFAPILFLINKKLGKLSKNTSIVLAIFLVAFPTYKLLKNYNYINQNPKTVYRTLYISPLRIVTNAALNIYEIKKLLLEQEKLQKLPHSWKIKTLPENDNNELLVFVIGESVRKDYMQIYNAQLNNTPFLESIPTITFENARSYASQTIESLSNTFILADQANNLQFPNNVVSLAKEAKFNTIWLSNQGSVGTFDNTIAAIAKVADSTNFITRGHYLSYKKDTELLPIFKKHLENGKGKTVFFLHTIGSHPNPCDIVEDQYTQKLISKNISCYVESIRRTDDLLRNIYENLESTGKKFKIIYFSDHGLKITDDKIMLHDNQFKECYDIPLLIIDSEMKHKVRIKESRNLKHFLVLYKELLNIETDQIKNDYKFISEDIDKESNKLYKNVDYNQLKSNPTQL